MFHLSAWLVKERVSLLKLTDSYDILDPGSGAEVGMAREAPATWVKLLRLAVHKVLLPTRVVVTGPEAAGSPELVTVRKPGLFGRSITVTAPGRLLGALRRPFFSFRTYLRIHDPEGNQIAVVKGDWKGWNFTVTDGNGENVGVITKKWAGLGKELFTSADNYIVQVEGAWAVNQDLKALLLSSALAIDIVYKESR